MKVTLLHLDTSTKPSLISESVTETRINIHPTGKNLTTQHTHGLSDLTYGNSSQRQSMSRSGFHLSLVHVFHALPLQAIHGWPIHHPGIHYYRNGEVSSDSVTINATRFTGLHKSRMRQYLINVCSSGPNRHCP
jgi:hypothetical protein